MEGFGLPSLIDHMKGHDDLWRMGHGQNQEASDLGLGWLYYGLARALRPSLAVVIGSWRGFVPMLIGQAIQDANSNGKLIFIDPSFVDGQWKDDVTAYFQGFGVNCVSHYCQTSEDFLASHRLTANSVDLLFIDGYHTAEQCRLEYEGFTPLLAPGAMTLFHDSASHTISKIYGQDRKYEHTVWRYIEELKRDPGLEVTNVEIAKGVALVRRSGH